MVEGTPVLCVVCVRHGVWCARARVFSFLLYGWRMERT